MSENRKETRKKLIAFAPVYFSSSRVIIGYVKDLTLQGAKVIGEIPVETNKETTLTIDFPTDLPNPPTSRVTIPARIVWCRQDEFPSYFNIGVEFIEVNSEEEKIIRRILDRYQFQNSLPDSDKLK